MFTTPIIVLAVLVAYTHLRSKGLLHIAYLKLREKAENRSEYQKHLLRQEFAEDLEMLDAINFGEFIRPEDLENDSDIQKIVVERAQLLFLRNLCTSVIVVLIFI